MRKRKKRRKKRLPKNLLLSAATWCSRCSHLEFWTLFLSSLVSLLLLFGVWVLPQKYTLRLAQFPDSTPNTLLASVTGSCLDGVPTFSQ